MRGTVTEGRRGTERGGEGRRRRRKREGEGGRGKGLNRAVSCLFRLFVPRVPWASHAPKDPDRDLLLAGVIRGRADPPPRASTETARESEQLSCVTSAPGFAWADRPAAS